MALIKHDERYGPYMTANNAPAPYAATASQNSWGAFRAFSESLDDDISFTGLAAGTEQWVQIKLDAPIRIWAFRIACRTTVSAKDAGQVPKNFTVQGSADGNTFEDIQIYTDMDWTQFTSWDATNNKYDWTDSKKIEITCAKEYQYYRFVFGECQSVSTQKTGSMTPTSSATVKPTLIDLYQVEGEESPEITVTGIRITHEPDKTRYGVGEALDTAGLEVTADLSDGSVQAVTDYTLSGYDSAAIGQKTVMVTYQGHTATFTVMVYELSSIAITTPPAKVQYNVGEELDLTGMVVTATYSDGITETVTDYTVSGYDGSVAGTCTVVVAYRGETVNFEVTVAAVSPGLTLEALLNTTEGMEVIRDNTRNDDGTDTVTGVDWFTYAGRVCSNIYVSGNNWIGFGTSSEQLKICRRDGAVYYVYRQEGVLDGGTKFLKIRVEGYTYYSGTTDDYKLIYEVFLFDDGCLYLNIVQSPTNSSYIGASSIIDGTNTATLNIPVGVTSAAPVEITVEGAGSAQSIYYERYPRLVPVAIEVTTLPAKTTYYGNELFDATGLVVSLVGTDGRKKVTDDYTLSGFDSSTAGTKIVTATQGTFTAVFEITISEISITGLEVTTLPNKVEYIPGAALETTGLEVSFALSDSNLVAADRYTVGRLDSATPGNKTITVSYNAFTTMFSVNVLSATSIEVTQIPYKNKYALNDTLNRNGLIVKAVYPNGETNTVTSYTLSEFDSTTVGPKEILVTFENHTASFTVQVGHYLSEYIGALNREDVVATLNTDTGLMTIEGSGEIMSFMSVVQQNMKRALFPENTIKDVVIEEGITNISSGLFAFFAADVIIENLFSSSSGPGALPLITTYDELCGLDTITIADSVTAIDSIAFMLTFVKKKVEFGRGITVFSESAFELFACPLTIARFSKPSGTRDISVCGLILYETSLYDEVSGIGYNDIDEGLEVLGFSKLMMSGENPIVIEIPREYNGRAVKAINSSAAFMLSTGSVIKIPDSVDIIEEDSFSTLFNIGSEGPVGTVVADVDQQTDSIPGAPWGAAYVCWRDTVRVTGIELTRSPENLAVLYGTVDFSQYITVVATFSDGTSREVTDYQCTVSGTGDTEVNVWYYDKSVSFPVTMAGREEISEIIITSLPIQTVYYLNSERIDKTGLVISAVLKDGRSITLNDEQYSCDTHVSRTSGTQQIEVTFGEFSASFDIQVENAMKQNIGLVNPKDAYAYLDMSTMVAEVYGSGKVRTGSLFNVYYNNTYTRYNVLKVIIHDGIENISDNMFDNFQSLESIDIPNTVDTIGRFAFQACKELQAIDIPASVKIIGEYAFVICDKLKSVILHEGLERIEYDSFSDVVATEMNIPSTVAYIGQSAFSNTLTDIYIKGKEVEFYDSGIVIRENTRIHGYIGSTAQIYAEKYNRTFIPMDILERIEVTPPTKLNYYMGEPFDAAGMVVTAIYSDGSTAFMTDYTLSGFDSTSSGAKTITVTYQDKTATFTVEILAVTAITITSPPDKVSYNIGETLDTTGLTVTATYSDGTSEAVTDYTLSGFDSTTVGTKSVNVECYGKSASFNITITVIPGVSFASLLNTTVGMEVIRDGEKTTSGIPDVIRGVDWFVYNGTVADKIYIYSTRWMGFGVSQAQLCVCTGNGCVNYVYRQQGKLDVGIEFLKIRVEGYSSTWESDYAYCKVIYEAFLFDDGYMFVNVIQTPTRSSFLGTSSITDGTNTESLTIPTNVTGNKPVEITVQDAGRNQRVSYGKYTPIDICGIEIKTLPTKTEYLINEVFDKEGLEVNVLDAQGNKRQIYDFIVYGFDSSASGASTVTIIKDVHLTTFDVTISDKAITSITVDVNKTKYFPRQGLDLSTLVVKGNLSDGTIIEITKGYTFSGFDSSSPQVCDVTAVYGNLESSFQVTVMEPKSIWGSSYSLRSPIFIGDPCSLSISRMTVEYENGEREEVTEGFEYTFPDTSTVGEKEIVARYYTVSYAYKVDVVRYLNADVGTPNKSDVTMEFDCLTGMLSFQGTGKIRDFQYEISIPGSFVDKLKTIVVSDDITGMEQTYLYYRSNVETISLGEKFKEIPSSMFMYCEALNSVTVSSNLEVISDQAFMDCVGLQNLTLPDSISVLGARCFYNCGFEEFTIPDDCKVEELSQTFLSCKSLKRVYIGKNVKRISSGTFPYTDTPTITVNNKEDAITGASWDAPSGSTVVWLIPITSITITALPNKVGYEIGEEFDDTGLAVSATYSDGSSEPITGYTLSGFDSTQPGVKPITVTYKEHTTTFEVGVYGTTTGIRIAQYPNKVYYRLNDTLDATGLQVVATTEGGAERPITDYTLSELDSSTVGNKWIIVTYETPVSDDTTAVYTAYFAVKVTATGDNPFEDTTELVEITVHWPNGEFADLTNADLAGGNGTMELRESICSDNYFIFGGCISNMLKFTTHSAQFISTEESAYPHGDIEVYVECKGTRVKIFTGTIDSGKRRAGLTQRDIIAYDKLYQFRNTDIAWWYKNKTTDKQMVLTQKQFRDELFSYLGIEQVLTKLYYDDAYVPNTNISGELNAVRIIKDMCLQNNVFGWINRDGKFEYLKLPENSRRKSHDNAGNVTYEYFPATVYVDNYESCDFTEGRVWYPTEFYSDPNPQYGFSSGPPNAQEAYERNVYYNRNSFFIGNYDWLDTAWLVNEYGVATIQDPAFPICFGPFADIFRLYRAQGYNVTVRGNPLNKVGDTIEITVRKTADDGTQLEWVIHSYIMSRTLKILGDTSMYDTYSARNAPYNGNNTKAGTYTPELSAELFRMRSDGPVISYADFDDGTSTGDELKKARLKCVKSLTEAEYTALQASSVGLRTDTLYFIKE